MPRPIHFEIQATDLDRAIAFYAEVFGWRFDDYSSYVGSPYFGVVTGEPGEPGINGGLVPRATPVTGAGHGANAFVVTIGVDDYDVVEARILTNGGRVAVPKAALPGMAWQGYYLDPEGNVFGIHQEDPNAA